MGHSVTSRLRPSLLEDGDTLPRVQGLSSEVYPSPVHGPTRTPPTECLEGHPASLHPGSRAVTPVHHSGSEQVVLSTPGCVRGDGNQSTLWRPINPSAESFDRTGPKNDDTVRPSKSRRSCPSNSSIRPDSNFGRAVASVGTVPEQTEKSHATEVSRLRSTDT